MKDADSDRLISWPRSQNTLFATPPDVDLPHPGVLSRVHIPHARARATLGFELDVSNMFHQLVLPRWLSLLLPVAPVAFGDLAGHAQRVVMLQLGLKKRPPQNTRLRPHLRTMPMGFSWAVHIAHVIARTLLRSCIREVVRDTSFKGRIHHLSKYSTQFSIDEGDVGISHIIDDVCLIGFGFCLSFLLAAQESIWSSFARHGLPIKKSKSTPVGKLLDSKVTFIGFEWWFHTGIIRPKADRIASACSLRNQSDASFTSLSPKALQTLVGKVLWLCIARRPLLSLLRCAVLPCALTVASARLTTEKELRHFGCLAKFAEIHTHRPLSTLIMCTDASHWGGALVVSRASCAAIRDFLDQARYFGGVLPPVADRVREFVSSRPWRVVLSYPWRHETHINELEAAAILIAVRWFATQQPCCRRVLLLSDSAVFLGVLATGRSSASPMMRYARHVGAVLLAHDLDLNLVHVPTDSNPADAPSRSHYPTGHVVWPSSHPAYAAARRTPH